ncbi:hypothetical protein [Paenibacillus sp. GXUN7292]|uniref:hypothetical protein n=1 Tax=Paenibacillus sp. GXUN7292 TaxID=3422499 RepID=UPI003D7EEB02
MNQLPEIVKQYLEPIGIKEGTEIYQLIEIGFEYAPYIGKVIQSIKMHRFGLRLKENSRQIEEIQRLLLDTKLDRRFIQERVFPIVLDDLIEDHEDQKIHYILSGLTAILNEYATEESEILLFYDTLRALRIYDLQYLGKFDMTEGTLVAEYTRDFVNVPAIDVGVINKLERLGIIRTQAAFLFGDDKKDVHEDRLILTTYGKRFLEFLK